MTYLTWLEKVRKWQFNLCYLALFQTSLLHYIPFIFIAKLTFSGPNGYSSTRQNSSVEEDDGGKRSHTDIHILQMSCVAVIMIPGWFVFSFNQMYRGFGGSWRRSQCSSTSGRWRISASSSTSTRCCEYYYPSSLLKPHLLKCRA